MNSKHNFTSLIHLFFLVCPIIQYIFINVHAYPRVQDLWISSKNGWWDWRLIFQKSSDVLNSKYTIIWYQVSKQVTPVSRFDNNQKALWIRLITPDLQHSSKILFIKKEMCIDWTFLDYWLQQYWLQRKKWNTCRFVFLVCCVSVCACVYVHVCSCVRLAVLFSAMPKSHPMIISTAVQWKLDWEIIWRMQSK